MRHLIQLSPLALLACSPSLFQPEVCSTSADCASAFGAGAVCTPSGYCTVGDDTFVNGVSAGAVKTVGIVDLTGSVKDLGGGMRDGVLAALEAHNRENPTARQFIHETLDDGYNPETSVAQLESVLAGDGINEGRSSFAVLGATGSPTTIAMLPLINQAQIPIIGTYSGAEHLRASPPDRVVFNTRASYRSEGQAIADYLLHRTPIDEQIPATNVFSLAQSSLTIETNGLTDIGATAGEDLDTYGLSGFNGIRDALRTAGVQDGDMAVASYRATNTDTGIASDYYFRWLLGLERLSPVIPESDRLRIGVAMVAVAATATPFITEVIDGMKEMEAGNPPSGVTFQEWEDTPQVLKNKLANAEVVLTAISPVGNQLPTNLKSLDETRYCQGINGANPVIVSQVVPNPEGGTTGALEYAKDLQAYDPNILPSFVTFEGWIAGKTFVEAVIATGDQLNVDNLVTTLESDEFSVNIGAVLQFSPDDHEGSDSVYGSILGTDCLYGEFTAMSDLSPL